MKTCNHCGLSKDAEDFHRDKTRGDGLDTVCKRCRRARVYGLSAEEFDALKAIQACEICGWDQGDLQIDHDHQCCPGERTCGLCIRGALCGYCNSAIAYFKEETGVLMQAIIYLERTAVERLGRRVSEWSNDDGNGERVG